MAIPFHELTDRQLDQFARLIADEHQPQADDVVDRVARGLGVPAAGSSSELTPEELAEKTAAEQSLHQFMIQAWHIVEPDVDFLDNWHIAMIADHLEAVLFGTEVPNLLINIPPGCMKSYACSVFLTPWAWIHNPSMRFLYAAYEANLSTRDSMRCRQILHSDWYRKRWGKRFKLIGDQNEKTKYENDKRGWRMSTSVGGRGTGEHPDVIVTDDPLKAKDAESATERQAVIDWWDGTISSRGKIRGSRRVIVMQRLHQEDLSGHVLETDEDIGRWVHVCLPMRFEPDRSSPSPLGWSDPRDEPGELLWPGAFNEQRVRELETEMGSLRSAGQLQQRPVRAGGQMFREADFKIVPAAPAKLQRVRYWDKAACLIGPSLIDCGASSKPICELRIGDRVMTRGGMRSVLAAGISGYVTRLTTVVFADGRQITGTHDHPVWEETTQQWQPLERLVERYDGSKAGGMFASLGAGTSIATNGIPKAAVTSIDRSTATFGRLRTAQSPVAVISTTSTEIGATIGWRISRSSRLNSTERNTLIGCVARKLLREFGLQALHTHNDFEKWAGSVTVAVAPTMPEHRRPATAKAAGFHLHGQSGARNATSAVVCSAPSSRHASTAAAVVRTAAGVHAVPVYDLTVEGRHEFIAGGLVVHNTDDAGAYSTGVRMGIDEHGQLFVEHVVRAQVSPYKRNQLMLSTAAQDAADTNNTLEIYTEQEPGSGGKESAMITVAQLRAYPVHVDRVTGDKVSRALPFAAQVEAGNVHLVQGPWNREYIDEHKMFPNGKYKDLVDGSSGAYNKLVADGRRTIAIDDILASGDPEHLAEEHRPFSADEIDELPDFLRDLITETRASAKDRDFERE